jgi:hypothetical protein
VQWRIDKHPGHEKACAGEQTHIHLPPDDRVEYYPEVEFDEVLAKVQTSID